MLKMFINDEEVISNQTFEINEEMLNTSSVILNNVYPKSWEENKDYVNNFYYPQDYSKCIIAEGDFEEGSQEFSRKESTGSFETNTEQNLDGLYIEGNTEQNGTPTPTNPIEIKTVKGWNLFNISNDLTKWNIKSNNADITKTENKITISTKSSSASGFYCTLANLQPLIQNYDSNKTYYISADIETNQNAVIRFGNESSPLQTTVNGKKRITNISKINSAFILYGFVEGLLINISNVQISGTDKDYQPYNTIQLSLTQPTEYEPYKENTSIIDLQGNELAKIGDVKDELNIDNNGNVTLTKRIGKVVLDGNNNLIYETALNFNQNRNRYSIYNIDGTGYDGTQSRNIIGISNVASYTPNPSQYPLYDETFLSREVVGQKFRIDIMSSSLILQNNTELKNWLSINKPVFYYQLAEEQMINLGNIQLSKTYKGINNVQLISDIQTSFIVYYLWKNYDLLFAGVVENTGNISLRPTDAKYCSLQILDFKTFLSEGETLDFVINNKTIIEAIQMVIDACGEYGFILGDVNIIGADDIIGAYSTLDKTPYDVFQYIADITQSRWTTRMIDSKTIAIDFYDPTLLPKGESIQYNNNWFKENEIINISFNYSSRDYRNKQVMTSDKVFADIDYIETIYADGFNSKYLLSQEVGTIKSILLNGINKSFTSNQNKELGITADFYYSIESNELTSDEILASGSKIDITYQPLVQGRQVIRNSNEINRISNLLNRKGVISRYENRNDSLSSEELNKIGQSYIKYKGTPEITLTVETFSDLWKIGNVVMFNAPIEELNQEYMVKSKKTKIIASIDKVFYTYILTSSFNSETEINYFDNQRNKAKGNLQEGQFINRNIDFESEANIIWNNFQYEEVSTTADNILDSLLNSPFVK